MKIVICDDDSAELLKDKNAIIELITSVQYKHEISLDTFSSGDALLKSIEKHGSYDILILDIMMPGMSGIELAEEIRRSNNNCKIIFLTSSQEFALYSYKVKSFYYLLKPFSRIELNSIISEAINEMGEEKSKSIVLKEKRKLTRVQIYRIIYIESVKHTINFHLNNNEVISSSGTLTEFSDILLSAKQFIQCHKSFIVNMNYVSNISNKDFTLEDKTLIPISRQLYINVKNKYLDYFLEK